MWLRRLAVAGVAGVGALIAADAVINDEVDDWTEPAKRFFSPPPKPEGPKKKVVVLGSGWVRRGWGEGGRRARKGGARALTRCPRPPPHHVHACVLPAAGAR